MFDVNLAHSFMKHHDVPLAMNYSLMHIMRHNLPLVIASSVSLHLVIAVNVPTAANPKRRIRSVLCGKVWAFQLRRK